MAFFIGPFAFDGGPWLAPLAATSNAAFRRICLDLGCEQAVTEMVSSEALVREVDKVGRRMRRAPGERRLVVQLFGADASVMARAAHIAVQVAGADIVDINMGCPVRKIVGVGAGVALMRDIALAERIVREVVEASSGRPVTVKMRAGWDDQRNAVEVARAVEQAGVKAIAVHARTREGFHTAKAQWDAISAVKQAVQVPVIGNGGVRCLEQAAQMIAQTGCDAVMIGRGALGNPWVFRKTLSGELYEPSVQERFSVIRRHLSLYEQDAGSELTAREMRKHLGWYLRGQRGSAMIRMEMQRMDNVEAMLQALDAYECVLLQGKGEPSDKDFPQDLPKD